VVTLDLLWQEYREAHPDGYPYRGFCEHYRAFARALPVTLRNAMPLGSGCSSTTAARR
jgi:transposase